MNAAPSGVGSGEGAPAPYSPAARRTLIGDVNMARAIVGLMDSFRKPSCRTDSRQTKQTPATGDTAPDHQEPK